MQLNHQPKNNPDAHETPVNLSDWRLYQAMQERQLHFATILEITSDAIISIDERHKITLFNKGAEAIFGYSTDEALGCPLDILLPERFRNVHRQHIAHFAASETTTHLMSGRQEIIGRRKNGEEFPVEASISKLNVGDTQIFTVVLRDISQRKQVEQQREQLIEELDAFAYTAAHDLKGSLGLIVGYADLLKTEARLPDDLQNYLNAIHRVALKMNGFINELHLLAAVNRIEIEQHPLHMARIVAEAQQRLAFLIQQYQAQIIMPQNWPAAMGYAPWVEVVWANFISNAIKYGGHPPKLQLGATTGSNDTIRFWIRDNGPGLTAEDQARLFKPFIRLNHPQANDNPPPEGHGVGLATVYRIVTQLGGEVGVESDVTMGQGSTFWFTLNQAP